MGEPAKSYQARSSNWVKTLAAPLFVFSIALHGLLLVAPLPSRPAPEVEEEAEASEEFVDLLSISTLATPEPELEPELPNTPPAETAAPPPTQPTAPTAPTQPIVPEEYPETPPPEQSLAETVPPEDSAFTAEPEPEESAAFVQEEEVVEIFSRLTRGSGDSDFDSTATSFPYAAYATRQGIQEWSPQEQACFFTQISAESYATPANVASLRYLTRNVQFIETQDIPRTFPPPDYQISSLSEGYCGRPLFQVLRQGNPYLFISVVGIGVGAVGQQASGLVIIWTSDPRAG